MAAPLKDSSTLQSAIKKHEGFRSTPYWDVNGYAIGYGQHTNPLTGRPVQPSDFIDKSAADSLLSSAIQPYADRVYGQVGPDIWNKMTANQQNAMVDLAYNYGSVPKDVLGAVKQWDQTGDASVVSDALIARGQRDNGGILMNRRQDEADAFANDKPLTGATGSGSANGGGGAGGPGAAAAGAGGAGGGAGCAGGMIGAMGMMAMGGMLGGLGIGSVFSGITGPIGSAISGITGSLGSITSSITGALGNVTGALQGAMGGITSALGNLPGVGQLGSIANSLSGGILGQISSIGSNIIPGLGNVIPGVLQGGFNQLMSPLNAVLQNPLNIVGVAQQFSAQGGLAGFVKNVANNMAGNFVGGTIQNLVNNVSMANGLGNLSRSLVGGVTEAMGQSFGSGIGGLGALVRNVDGLATFGMSTLGNNLGAVAADMIATGNWDTKNLTRLMQPGNIAAQIVARGLGESTGLLPALVAKGIPLAGIDNPIYDSPIRGILSNITNNTAITDVSKAFGVGMTLANLGQLTDINYMMKNSASSLPVSSFADLGLTLTSLQITQAATLKDIGDAFLKVESTRDLNHISTMPTPIHKPTAELITKSFGYGSGTFGEITMADSMGTVAGYVHEDTFPVIVDNVTWLKTKSEADQYFKGVDLLEHLVVGDYTTSMDNSIDTITYTYTVPYNEAGFTNGQLGTFTDFVTYTGGDPATAGALSGSGLAAAAAAVIDYIEDGMLILKNSTDPQIQAAIDAIDAAHNASICQVLREATMLKVHEVDIFQPAKMTPINAYAFAMSLTYYALDTGHGRMADFLEKMCQDNLYGDAIKAAMRQARNAQVLSELGVNIERYNLPSGMYYRDPLMLTQDLYNGIVPSVPLNVQNIYYPKDPVDQYVLHRDAKISDNGAIDPDTLPAERDEMYYDMLWDDAADWAKRQIGERAVSEAIARNLKLFGDDLTIVDLDKRRYTIGKVTPSGIVDLDSGTLISILFDVVNKILYGNIGTTKNDNPFQTEQMIYAVAEAMGDANASTVAALLETYLGQTVMKDMLARLANKFRTLNTVNDTRMDRNDPASYGGIGPGIDKRFTDS